MALPEVTTVVMPEHGKYDFVRYLTAKKSVDDRALNRRVWQTLREALFAVPTDSALRVLEVGGGIGTMIERMLDWGLLPGDAEITMIDAHPENIIEASRRLPTWAIMNGFSVHEEAGGSIRLFRGRQEVRVVLEACDLFDFIARERGRTAWHLILAHAFMDLMNISETLSLLASLAVRYGLLYFSINFDGVTALEPATRQDLDGQIELLYHRTMDERLTAGRPSGDSHSGRRLFEHVRALGARILDAGGSDWVVFSRGGAYPHDEAYFLHFIVQTIHSALKGSPQLSMADLDEWAARRHEQIDRGELVYIAHQLDLAAQLNTR
jgi:hypothetical protein